MLQINLSGVLVSCDGDGSYHEIPKSIPSDTVYLSMVNFNFGALQRANFTRLKTVECMIIMDSGKPISYYTKFLVDTCPFVGPLMPLFWTSGDVSSGFQSQSGQPYSHLAISELY